MKSAAIFFRVGNARKRLARADSPHESDALTGADAVTHCMPIPTRFRKCCVAIYRSSDIYDATQNNWHMKHAMRSPAAYWQIARVTKFSVRHSPGAPVRPER